MGMYFYGVDKPVELGANHPGGVYCQCKECGKLIFAEYEDFKEFREDYIVLRDGVLLECPQCKTPIDRIVTLRPEHLEPQPTN